LSRCFSNRDLATSLTNTGEPTVLDCDRAQGGTRMYVPGQYCVYILASKRNGTLYTGITSDLARRVPEHKNDVREGFTSRYGVHMLVWCEVYEDIQEAIAREKRIKKWRRKWKIALIEEHNPRWLDLAEPSQLAALGPRFRGDDTMGLRGDNGMALRKE
jgi:putative endonuclease